MFPEPGQCAFAGVASSENTRVALKCAALRDLPPCSCDAQNTCFQDPSFEKHRVVCSPEFVLKNAGNRTITLYTLHDSKSSRANYWWHARSTVETMGFSLCKTDPNTWLRRVLNSDEVEHYQRSLLCPCNAGRHGGN